VLDLSAFMFSILQKHDIEPTSRLSQPVPSQILRRQPHKARPLPLMHRIDRPSEGGRSTSFDFDEDQHRAVLRHEIDFAARRPNVPGKDTIPLPSQVPFGCQFGILAEAVSPVVHLDP
jgi:hypothetical protein